MNTSYYTTQKDNVALGRINTRTECRKRPRLEYRPLGDNTTQVFKDQKQYHSIYLQKINAKKTLTLLITHSERGVINFIQNT